MILELAMTIGLHPKKTSSTRGGEFHSACPSCGGTDRFAIWPKSGRYWCRQCKTSGDAINFCREFMGMSFHEAQARVGKKNDLYVERSESVVITPPKSWEDKACAFVQGCHQRLLMDPRTIDLLKERGLSVETVQTYLVGWNPVTQYVKREEWGLEKKVERGVEKKFWIPSGIVIPTFHEHALHKIKIRRHEWCEGDAFGKYYILPGSVDVMPIFGDQSMDVVVVVEAELDAMLVAQEAGSISCCLALGGAQKRPSESIRQWLLQKNAVLLALDFDEAGKKECPYWHSTFANVILWPPPVGKSSAEAHELGVDLRAWVLAGICHRC